MGRKSKKSANKKQNSVVKHAPAPSDDSPSQNPVSEELNSTPDPDTTVEGSCDTVTLESDGIDNHQIASSEAQGEGITLDQDTTPTEDACSQGPDTSVKGSCDAVGSTESHEIGDQPVTSSELQGEGLNPNEDIVPASIVKVDFDDTASEGLKLGGPDLVNEDLEPEKGPATEEAASAVDADLSAVLSSIDIEPMASTPTRPLPPSRRRSLTKTPVGAPARPAKEEMSASDHGESNVSEAAAPGSDQPALNGDTDDTGLEVKSASGARRPAPPGGGRRRLIKAPAPGAANAPRRRPSEQQEAIEFETSASVRADASRRAVDLKAVQGDAAPRFNSSPVDEAEIDDLIGGTSVSGVSINRNCLTTFLSLKSQAALRFITFAISEDGSEVVPMDTGAADSTLPALLSVLPQEEPRYAVYDYPYTNADGCLFKKLLFILWSPEVASIKNKMMYASTKDFFKGKLSGLAVDLQ
eukprot:gene2664-3433_t